MLRKQRQHRFTPTRAGDMRAHARVEEEMMRNAGHGFKRQRLGGRRFVVGEAMRDGAVEADVVAEGEVARLAPAHRDQPATGADVDGNAMSGAIAPDRLDEDAFAAGHGSQSFLSPKAAKMRASAPSRGEDQSYS
ncbi:hypothetical protein ACVJA9_001652 [Bradyrhizobium diazoefficiens]